MNSLPRLMLNGNIGAVLQLQWIDWLSDVHHAQNCDFNRKNSRERCVDEAVQVTEKSAGKVVRTTRGQ